MIALDQAILALVPAATFGPVAGGSDVVLEMVSGTQMITYWPTATLGTEPTQTQLNAVTQAQGTSAIDAAQRTPAINILSAIDPSGNACLLRAFVVEVVKQLNALREWNMGMQSAVVNNSTLATIQSAVKALQALPDITKAQVITALQNEINAGSGDTTTS